MACPPCSSGAGRQEATVVQDDEDPASPPPGTSLDRNDDDPTPPATPARGNQDYAPQWAECRVCHIVTVGLRCNLCPDCLRRCAECSFRPPTRERWWTRCGTCGLPCRALESPPGEADEAAGTDVPAGAVGGLWTPVVQDDGDSAGSAGAVPVIQDDGSPTPPSILEAGLA